VFQEGGLQKRRATQSPQQRTNLTISNRKKKPTEKDDKKGKEGCEELKKKESQKTKTIKHCARQDAKDTTIRGWKRFSKGRWMKPIEQSPDLEPRQTPEGGGQRNFKGGRAKSHQCRLNLRKRWKVFWREGRIRIGPFMEEGETGECVEKQSSNNGFPRILKESKKKKNWWGSPPCR